MVHYSTLVTVFTLVILGVSIVHGQTCPPNGLGSCNSACPCANNFCCSVNGFCGTSSLYCGAGCTGGPCTSGSSGSSSSSGSSTSSSSSGTGSSTTGSVGPTGFNHPGILVGLAQLNYIKQQAQSGTGVAYTAYQKALSSQWGSLSYAAKGPQFAVIDCGSFSNPNNGCSDDDNDSTAAYLQALLFYITGNTQYAQNAINLMNAYARTVTGFSNSNAPLQAAWSAQKWPRAAEIIRHTSTLWADSDFNKFTSWLTSVHLPLIQGGSSASNGNWELSMIEGTMNIGILTDNQNLFNSAVSMWQARVPSYFYTTSDGSSPVKAPRGTSDWYTQTLFNSEVNGICQETCRDMGHTQYGLASTLNSAATASAQGVDLFTQQQTRLVAAMEFNAQWVNGVTPPSYVCAGTVDASTLYPTWELGYNHFHNKAGVSMPNTLEFINNYVRKQSTLTDTHICVWETLTNSGFP